MSCQMAASQSWDLCHNDLKTAFLQGQSYDVNRDVVCQLPPEAGHPPKIAARLKKPAYGMNHAPRRWWNILDKALYCILCSRVNKHGNTGYKGPPNSRRTQKKLSPIHVSNQKWKLRLKRRWILQLEVQPQEHLWQESSVFLCMIYLEQVEKKWNNVF